MPKPMRVTPETMSSQGGQLTATGESMASGLSGLASTIDGAGSPWGGDEQGSLFEGLYQTVLTQAFTGISSHVQQVRYAGAALSGQAQGYGQTETGISQGLNSAAGQLQG